MTMSEAGLHMAGEPVEPVALAPLPNGFHLEPRCRVCRSDSMRGKVNDMLATGASYAMILRALADDDAKLDKRDRVTIDSILPTDDPLRALNILREAAGLQPLSDRR